MTLTVVLAVVAAPVVASLAFVGVSRVRRARSAAGRPAAAVGSPDGANFDAANMERHFQPLLEAAPDAMVIVDASGRIALVNRQVEKLFGYSRQELLGELVEILVPEHARGLHAGHRRGFEANPHTRSMGAGFASFYYLKHLSFDHLKIDGEFIQDLTGNHVNQLVVRSVVSIARGLGKRTTAEFVGDQPTVELLREYGVDYAQGYHIGHPTPVSEVDFDQPSTVGALVR